MTSSGTQSPSDIMSKTKRNQPIHREEERWLRKGGGYSGPSRRKQKQDLMHEAYENVSNYRRR